MPTPTLYIIAGCNGAGKTTFAKEFLPHEVKCLRFYNVDEMPADSRRLIHALARSKPAGCC
jgi:predicted ABC-type ATPase